MCIRDRGENNSVGWEEDPFAHLDSEIRSDFVGYDSIEAKGKIIAIVKKGETISEGRKDDEIILLLDRTPFYAESGGQVGDKGVVLSLIHI